MKTAARTDPDETPLPRDAQRSLPLALLRSREVVMARFRPMLAGYDLTDQQWRVIRVLAEKSPRDATEVAQEAFILAPSLTRIIRSLEERGLITRQRDAEDARRAVLALTASGRDLVATITPHSRRIYADLEERYGRERMESLLDLLGELAALR